MHVTVYMRQAQACSGKALKLSFKLDRQFSTGRTTEGVPQAGTPGLGEEDAVRVSDVRHLIGWQRSSTTGYYHVQSDSERWCLSRHVHSFVYRVAGHHEAGTSQDTLPVCAHDGLVDAVRSAKIVGIQNDL
jgi:hypothetical protein